jgi:hypothetical protein
MSQPVSNLVNYSQTRRTTDPNRSSKFSSLRYCQATLLILLQALPARITTEAFRGDNPKIDNALTITYLLTNRIIVNTWYMLIVIVLRH